MPSGAATGLNGFIAATGVRRLPLSRKFGAGNVRCHLRDRDRYGRHVARCFSGEIDLNRWMVREGHAVCYRAYSVRYLSAEAIARINGTGIWDGGPGVGVAVIAASATAGSLDRHPLTPPKNPVPANAAEK